MNTYNIAAGSLARAGYWEGAVQLLQQAWLEGLSFNENTYTSLIIGCAVTLEWELA
eukprot:CAMPEP_0177281800 /NCGR_PEP_ID=MMETSP0367-20130122/71108_1 /TAXON_ID=447022 ORGANISM="Scrippsiella hangoei-like, Strain SHHI-4" /NCGR_SAMPLE_ID=MMETSP0367 /ASSEMBLY_ACC=CAM_ASM_000362 /LENGTH=55 /DNA_ID=CAMNT_0018738655 /DNA_START=15 /DNA_END=178 /DNA_ORIENTATION=-